MKSISCRIFYVNTGYLWYFYRTNRIERRAEWLAFVSFSGGPGSNLDTKTCYPDKVSRSFTQSFQVNAGIDIKLDYDRFLPHAFQSIIH